MADTKTTKHVVTNITGGPKVLNCMPPGILLAGDSTDDPVEMTEGLEAGVLRIAADADARRDSRTAHPRCPSVN